MEAMSGLTRTKEQRLANEAAIIALRRMRENKFAIGSRLGKGAFNHWLVEQLSGLNVHVRYLHTKYMLVDPLGTNPLVVSGSANFSEASTTNNDENMLIIRSNPRVADIYLGEFMRLYRHFAFRDWLTQHPGADEVQVRSSGRDRSVVEALLWRQLRIQATQPLCQLGRRSGSSVNRKLAQTPPALTQVRLGLSVRLPE